MATDSIVIPVELGNLDVEKFLQQIGPVLKRRITEVAQGMVAGQIPLAKPTVVAKERFEVGGKTFEATGRARLKAIEQSIGEGGERDIVALENYAVSIKEVKKKLSEEEKQRIKSMRELERTAKEAVKMKREFVESLVQLDVTPLKNTLKREFKASASVQPPEERIASIRKALADGLLPIAEANALIAKESKKFVDSIKATRRARFNEFTKRLQTVDPNIAIRELDNYINQRTATFAQDAKILRDRLQKQIQSARQQASQERNRRFANQALVGAGIGLGVLGNAGFPLLNIGFAAMSGGPVGAGIVGVATTLGEGTRAFSRYKESVTSAAKEIDFVSTRFKIAEARMKAFDAVIGSAAMSSERAANELRLEYYERNKLSGTLADTTRLFGDTWNAIKQQFTEAFGDTLQGKTFDRGDPFWETFRKQRESSSNNRLEELLSARRNYIAGMNKSNVGMETSGYEMWKRIQTAAFDPSKAEDRRIQEEGLKKLDELIRIEGERLKILQGILPIKNTPVDWGSWLGTL